MTKKPKLSLVRPSATGASPPRKLGEQGRNLWDKIMAEYQIADAGGLELLAQSCQALDRAEALREEIDRDGEIIRGVRGSIKEHPALKHELQNRAFLVRTLQKLGLNFEPVKAGAGRPARGIGWDGES